jgi:hypothetical protein
MELTSRKLSDFHNFKNSLTTSPKASKVSPLSLKNNNNHHLTAPPLLHPSPAAADEVTGPPTRPSHAPFSVPKPATKPLPEVEVDCEEIAKYLEREEIETVVIDASDEGDASLGVLADTRSLTPPSRQSGSPFKANPPRSLDSKSHSCSRPSRPSIEQASAPSSLSRTTKACQPTPDPLLIQAVLASNQSTLFGSFPSLDSSQAFLPAASSSLKPHLEEPKRHHHHRPQAIGAPEDREETGLFLRPADEGPKLYSLQETLQEKLQGTPWQITKDARELGLRGIRIEVSSMIGGTWIVITVIRGSLRGHNDAACGRPTPGRPVGHPGVGRP